MFKRIKPFVITITLVLQIFMFFSCKVGEQAEDQQPEIQLTQEEQALVDELNQWLYPFGSSPLDFSDNTLSFLDRLKSARIVALGESTHGTREFFQMKHRVFQYLVENLGHKVFGFEADFGECIYINKCIMEGCNDMELVMRIRMHFWTWKTREVQQLLEWMRDYNKGKSEGKKLQYFGVDCQFIDYQPELLHEYLSGTMPALWDTISPVINQVKDLSDADYGNMSPETFESLKTQLAELPNQFEANKNQLIQASSVRDYKINKHLLTNLLQAFIVNNQYYGEDDSKTNWRDLFMAENSIWLADLFGQDSKITLWAHNMHIARNRSFGNSGSQGYHLSQELGDLYKVVGFCFSKGYFSGIGRDENGNSTGLEHRVPFEPKRDSINFLFHHAAQPNFAFQLDNIPAGSKWDEWLATPRPFLMIGSTYNRNPDDYYRTVPVREDYDWILYFDTTSPSDMIYP